MEPTNQEGSDSRNSSSNNTNENLEEPKKATLGEIYEYITGPYYLLFIIGAIAALTGGKFYSLIFLLLVLEPRQFLVYLPLEIHGISRAMTWVHINTIYSYPVSRNDLRDI